MARPETEAQVPLQVRRAAQLLWLLVALMAVRTILTVGVYDAYRGNVALAFVTLVMLGGLLGLCALGVPRGQRWAQIVGVMFASAAALGGVSSLLNPSTGAFAVLGLVGAMVSVAAICFLCSRSANVFFRHRGR